MITYVTANHLKDLSSAGQTYEGLGRSQASPVCSAAQFPQISNEDLLETYHTRAEHRPKMNQKLFSVYCAVEHLSHFTCFLFFLTKKQVNTCFERREIVLGCRLPGSNWIKKQWVFLAKKGMLSKWAVKNWKWGPPCFRYRWHTPARNRSELSKLNYHKEHYLFPSEIACVTRPTHGASAPTFHVRWGCCERRKSVPKGSRAPHHRSEPQGPDSSTYLATGGWPVRLNTAAVFLILILFLTFTKGL